MSGAAVATADTWMHEESELGAVVREVAHRRASARGAMRGRRPQVVREIRLPEAAYRVRGSVLPQEDSSVPAIVVMLEKVDALPSDEEIRARFKLTRKEVGVARLLAEGLTNGELAEALTISPHTARHHPESVLSKLSVTGRREVRERLMEAAGALGGCRDGRALGRRPDAARFAAAADSRRLDRPPDRDRGRRGGRCECAA